MTGELLHFPARTTDDDEPLPRLIECPDCDGSGTWSEPDEDHPGHASQGECERCHGEGVIDVYRD